MDGVNYVSIKLFLKTNQKNTWRKQFSQEKYQIFGNS